MRSDEVGSVRSLTDMLSLLSVEKASAAGEPMQAEEFVDSTRQLINQVLLFGSSDRVRLISSISCGQTVSGNIAAPAQRDSYTFTAAVMTSTGALASESRRAH